MKQKWIPLLLAFALLLSLCACGGGDAPQNDGPAPETGLTDTAGHTSHPHDLEVHNNHTTNQSVTAAPDGSAGSADDTGSADGSDSAGQAETPEPNPSETPAEQPAAQPAEEQPAAQSTPKETKPAAPASETPPPAPKPEPEPVPVSQPEPEPVPVPEPEPEPAPEPEPEPEPEPAADPKATAQGLVGRPVSELYAAVGYPISSDYAPSCLDLEGEDGELVYDGFVVYTLRVGDSETIDSVA